MIAVIVTSGLEISRQTRWYVSTILNAVTFAKGQLDNQENCKCVALTPTAIWYWLTYATESAKSYYCFLLTLCLVRLEMLLAIACSQSKQSSAVGNCITPLQTPSTAMTWKAFFLKESSTRKTSVDDCALIHTDITFEIVF